jgi:nicotinamide-nucleotide amidase
MNRSITINILTIGDELLIGQTLDTNSARMGQMLVAEGFEIVSKETVGDSGEAILSALSRSQTISNVTLITGGLGPTKDDITTKTLAHFFRTKFVFNQDVYNNVERIILPRLGHINSLNRSQAMVPESARVFINRMGTAPILWFEHEKHIFVSMPGVPYEMNTAMENDIIPALKAHFSFENNLLYRTLVVGGITEAELAEKLESFEDSLQQGITLAYLPTPGFIKLRLSGKNMTDELRHRFSANFNMLISIVGEWLLSVNYEEPTKILYEMLFERGLTISTAESCTGGLIASKITQISGASKVFKGSVVAYNNDVKAHLLHVSESDLSDWGAVSETVVEQMATGVAKLLSTDISIAVSGIAGPDGGSAEKPVGTVWFAWNIKGNIFTKKVVYPFDRQVNIERTAVTSIVELIKYLKKMC